MSKPSSAKLATQLATSTFSQQVVIWYHLHGRKQLPWQQSSGEVKPFHVWLSEIMLQQTQVVKVIEYFNRFITELPTLKALADADEQQVLALWSGLGYYNRARNLHKTAVLCLQQYDGQLPNDLQQLIDLPGIGRSTAAAIMSLAYDQPEPIMDGNVKRVFARHFLVAGEPNKSSTLKVLWDLAETHKEMNQPAAYTQGLMDLGATVCTKHQPKCDQCPVTLTCLARDQDVIGQYPMKKQKVKQKEVELYVLLSTDGQSVALKQRDESSIWPNLWFLPLFETEETLLNEHQVAEKHFSLTHKLTHRILQLHVYKTSQPNDANPSNAVKMVNRATLSDWPHPKALIHILNQHDNLINRV